MYKILIIEDEPDIRAELKTTLENALYQAEAETVYCDEKWLEFILNQLVSNAVKYRRESGGRLESIFEELF